MPYRKRVTVNSNIMIITNSAKAILNLIKPLRFTTLKTTLKAVATVGKMC